jgi:hypothetical protein
MGHKHQVDDVSLQADWPYPSFGSLCCYHPVLELPSYVTYTTGTACV